MDKARVKEITKNIEEDLRDRGWSRAGRAALFAALATLRRTKSEAATVAAYWAALTGGQKYPQNYLPQSLQGLKS